MLALGLALLAATAASAAPLHLPPVLRARLSNGLRVFVVATNRVPLVDLRLVVRAGSVDDPVGKEGLSAMTAHLLAQGAGARSAKQIAADIYFVRLARTRRRPGSARWSIAKSSRKTSTLGSWCCATWWSRPALPPKKWSASAALCWRRSPAVTTIPPPSPTWRSVHSCWATAGSRIP
jgi:hypothetical protein